MVQVYPSSGHHGQTRNQKPESMFSPASHRSLVCVPSKSGLRINNRKFHHCRFMFLPVEKPPVPSCCSGVGTARPPHRSALQAGLDKAPVCAGTLLRHCGEQVCAPRLQEPRATGEQASRTMTMTEVYIVRLKSVRTVLEERIDNTYGNPIN